MLFIYIYISIVIGEYPIYRAVRKKQFENTRFNEENNQLVLLNGVDSTGVFSLFIKYHVLIYPDKY